MSNFNKKSNHIFDENSNFTGFSAQNGPQIGYFLHPKSLKIPWKVYHSDLVCVQTKALVSTKVKQMVQNTNDTKAVQTGTNIQKYKRVLCFVFTQKHQR